jgi:hypothetical protein
MGDFRIDDPLDALREANGAALAEACQCVTDWDGADHVRL